MRTFFCVVLAVAAVSASITTIGQTDSFLGNENPLVSFLHTAEPPRAVMGTGFERAMSADEQFANTFGSVTLDENSVFSKETVLGMVNDPQLLEAMGYGDREVFNGTELNAIAEFLQRSSTSARIPGSVVDNYLAHHDTNSEHGTKMCYCHSLIGHSTDDVEELDTDNPNLYIALFLGANKNDYGFSYNPGHEFGYDDYRICFYDEEVATNTACADTCRMALSSGNINGKFWETGCPTSGYVAKLTTASVESVDKTHYQLHAHVREIEEMKMFAVLTRSTDEKRFCSEFSKRETLKAKSAEAATHLKKGSLLEDSCESRVQRFMELANGDMYYVNSHVTALNACEQDGACNQEIGLRGMWPRLTGESCSACMARSYTAALDYEILERNNVETSTKSFCQLQRKIHPYLEEQLQDNECASIVQSFQSTRDATETALQFCSNVCDYAAPSTRTVDGQETNRVPLSQMDSSFWEEIKAHY